MKRPARCTAISLLIVAFAQSIAFGGTAGTILVSPSVIKYHSVQGTGQYDGASQTFNLSFAPFDFSSYFSVAKSESWLGLVGAPERQACICDTWRITPYPQQSWLQQQQPGIYVAFVTVTAQGYTTATVRVEVEVVPKNPQQSTAPVINAVVNAGYFSVYGFAPASLVTIYGEGLASSTASATSLPLPTVLAGTEVYFCRQTEVSVSSARGCSAPSGLLYVSPTQINFVLRYNYIDAGAVGIAARNNGIWDTKTQQSQWNLTRVILNWVSPGIFASGYDCPLSSQPCAFTATRTSSAQVLRATITDPEYRLISSANPAKPGGIYVAWLTGLGNDGVVGDIRNRLADLRLGIAPWPLEVNLSVIADAEFLYAGAVSGFVGLYQINFRIPPELARVTTACGPGQEMWLTLRGISLSPSIAFPLKALPADPACR